MTFLVNNYQTNFQKYFIYNHNNLQVKYNNKLYVHDKSYCL